MKPLIWVLFLLVSFLSVDSFAASKKVPPAPTRGRIISVDLKNGTITAALTAGAAPKAFVIDAFTTIEIEGKTASANQIKAGMGIRSIRLNSSTPPVAEDLDLVASGA